MKTKSRRTVLVALSALFTGCTSRPAGDDVSETTSTTSLNSPSATESPTATETTSDTETPIPTGEITTYDSLSTEGQELFRELLRYPVERASDMVPERLWNAEYIEKDTSLYKIRKEATGERVVERSIELTTVQESSVNKESLLRYSNLTGDAQSAIDSALETGRYTVRDQKLPGKLGNDNYGYLHYGNQYHKILRTVGDIQIWRLSVSEL